jgi:hypothetical protein
LHYQVIKELWEPGLQQFAVASFAFSGFNRQGKVEDVLSLAGDLTQFAGF